MLKSNNYYCREACEISPICDFLFGSFRTSLPTDTVNVELTVWMVKRDLYI